MKIDGEFADFISRQPLDLESKEILVETSKRILERTDLLGGSISCNCQLVVGEVQSGKTMSFTSLIALAHENGFPIVIVLAGTKDALLTQTSKRLIRDLNADGNGGANPWFVLQKPRAKDKNKNLKILQKTLNIWSEKDAPQEFKPTVVLTTLKNRAGMDSISALMDDLKATFPFDNYPVLIVDDEGDEAGLNLNWDSNQESTVYASIKRLRNCFPKHSYVMYTATPQGPLLISIQDTLSPKYVTLLTSGQNYVGGDELFLSTSTHFPIEIPASENQMVFDTSRGATPPPSLKSSLAYFLLTLQIAQSRKNPRPISMLVHPSVKKEIHDSYEKWVESILDKWTLILKDQTEDAYIDERRNFFEPAELELRNSVNLPEDWNLDTTLENLRWWIPKIEIRVINTDNNDIDPSEWLSKSGWILIGGNKLSRGFTIENLAVTYMPRPVGVGNADVIQQRGRFFGYKRKYIDLLRGWFFSDQIDAYAKYVDHEKTMRNSLIEIDSNKQELSSWRRGFLLDPAYQPVRNQVISMSISHQRQSVFKQQRLYDDKLGFGLENTFGKILAQLSDLQKFDSDKRTNRNNYFSSISLNAAFELLADWNMNEIDRQVLDDILWAAKATQDLGYLGSAEIVLMDYDPTTKTQKERERNLLGGTINKDLALHEQSINNLFQGSDKAIAVNYPGDIYMRNLDSMTIQIHKVTPMAGQIAHNTVLALAVIMPNNLPGFILERN
jgi:hypothetical protein